MTKDHKRGKVYHGPHTERGLHWKPSKESLPFLPGIPSWHLKILRSLPLLPLRCQEALGSQIGPSHSPPTWLLRACLVLGMGEGNTGPWSYALMSLALEQRKENERVQETAHNIMFSEHLPGPQDHLVMAMSAGHGKCYLRSTSDPSATEREPTHKHNP